MKLYTIADFISYKTGKINKGCRFCLKADAQDHKIILIDDLDDLNFVEIFPKSIIIVQKLYDLDQINLIELFKDFNVEVQKQTGYSFRITKSVEDHIYAKCRYSDKLQTKKIEKRKRNNFGAQKFECSGEINIHRNETSLSILVQHLYDHQDYLNLKIDEDVLKKIEEKAHGFSPSQIFKQIKSEISLNRIQNVSLSQIAYIWRKKNGHISGGLEKSLHFIRNSQNLNVLELNNAQGIINFY